ncbi:hypothetical protein NPIL_222611, partial [Nephila pilipes]
MWILTQWTVADEWSAGPALTSATKLCGLLPGRKEERNAKEDSQALKEKRGRI